MSPTTPIIVPTVRITRRARTDGSALGRLLSKLTTLIMPLAGWPQRYKTVSLQERHEAHATCSISGCHR
jgi:hypothetical protein